MSDASISRLAVEAALHDLRHRVQTLRAPVERIEEQAGDLRALVNLFRSMLHRKAAR